MKLKSIVSAALAISIMAGIAGCNVQNNKPTTTTTTVAESSTTESSSGSSTEESKESKPSESSEVSETASETTTETTKAGETKETAKASETTTGTDKTSETSATTTTENSGLATVSVYNAYKRTFKKGGKSYTTRYPKIMISGVSTTKVNKAIADRFKSIAKKNDSKVNYSYYVRKYLISVVVSIEVKAGDTSDVRYFVYNVSRINGKELTRAQVLKSLGMKESTFNSKVKAGIQKMWKSKYSKDTSAAKKTMEKNSLTTKTLNSAMPYLNKNGKISYLVRRVEVPSTVGHVDLYGVC